MDPSTMTGEDAKQFAGKLAELIDADPYCKHYNELVAAGKTSDELVAMFKGAGKMLENKPALLLQALKGSGPVLEKLAPMLEKAAPKLGPIGDVAAVGFYVVEVHKKGVKQGTIDFVKSATSYEAIAPLVHKAEAAKDQLEQTAKPSGDTVQPEKK